ncbi:hypothetical protein GGR39_003402 [Novosphingobium fluoreni]|uniref:Superinfection immunity protein n=1 Tax=Novosphingobium fluoreni TaxID=1391222 RepID=A0A7W6C1E2_9SPHN|nr:superinfection immunity protein [Novosphingobium fluoreni]MBB3941721.1 hypothetical protein [Novosphingobium fluoreni]
MAQGRAFQVRQVIGGFAVLFILLLGGNSAPANAADICNAVALIDIPEATTGYGLKKGEIDEAVTQYNVDRNGDGQFCSHGGGCYPRYIVVDGRKVEALRLTNCKIGAAEPPIAGLPDDDTTIYGIDVDRSKNSAADLKSDDVDNALLNLGMCSACASNAAYLYIHSPASKCGSKVADALAGDKSAIDALQTDPDYCQVSYPTPAAPATATTATPAPFESADAPAVAPPATSTTETDPTTLIKAGIAAAAILYFVPTLIAFMRRKRNARAIFALNLFLGWSFLGWVAALVWSLLTDGTSEQV